MRASGRSCWERRNRCGTPSGSAFGQSAGKSRNGDGAVCLLKVVSATQIFPGIDFNPAAGTITGNTSGVTNPTRPFTDVVTDRTGAYSGAIPAQGSGYQAGAGVLYSFSSVFTGTLNVPAAGQVAFTITSDDGFQLGIGGGASRVSGPQVNTPATTPFQLYPVMGGSNQRQAAAPSIITVNFPAAGAYPYELDYAKGGDPNLTLTLQANGAPIPAAALLTLSPASVPSLQAGQIQQLVLSATDADGIALQNVPVTVTVAGQNAQARVLTTDGTGQAAFAYAGSPLLPGIDTVQAAAHINGSDTYSNSVAIAWNNGTNQAPVVNAGVSQSATLPGAVPLTGSVTDDGLPSNALTVTWSLVSGPGAVTFDNPNQAVTAANLSQPGTYVLQLTATDGALSASSTVTITATVNPNWSSGWILSPADKTSVSGVVPVTLIPGITLTSGTLVYYPAANVADIHTITAATTGTGQIGSFDTTLLPNGSYFIDLLATNSVGVTQRSLALVTVIGDYKPGRVTATVTDLIVPAPGLPIKISRVYDSLVRNTSSDFGFGWRLDTSVQLSVSPTSDVTLTINGQRRTFYFTPPANPIFQYWYTPQYTAEPGLFGSLVTTSDNCGGVLQRQGNLWFCSINNAGLAYQASGFVYTDPYGRKYTIGSDSNLQSVTDLNNNSLTISATGITGSNGLNVPFLRDPQGRITKITDPLGNNYFYAYDASNNLQTVTYPNIPASVTTYTYDTTHLLKGGTDPRSNPLPAVNYYPDGKLQSVTDPTGKTTSYTYNLATNATTVTYPPDAAGLIGTATLVYDGYGKLLTSTDPLNHTTTNVYNANHTLKSTTDALNHTTSYSYDANGNQTSMTYPQTAISVNRTSQKAYNQFALQTSHTDEVGNLQTIAYDSNFHPTKISDLLNGFPAVFATFNYNANGTIQANAMGYDLVAQPNKATRYLYDQYGNKMAQIDPLGRQTLYNYDTMGRLLSTTPPLPVPSTPPQSVTTTNQYDAIGRLTQITAPLGKITAYTYDKNGNKLTETDANNHTTSYQYDALNRIIQVTYPTTPATITTKAYDFRGNVINATDESGHVTHNEYDLAGRLVAVNTAYGTPDVRRRTLAYDAANRKTSETDPNSQATTYNSDEAGRLTSIIDAQSHSTTYTYDDAGNGISVTDQNNHTTQYQYDSRRRPFKIIYPDLTFTTSTFDGAGQVTSVTDPAGKVVTYAYDDAEQLTSVVQANHPNPANNTTVYGYDPHGMRRTLTDGNGHITTNNFDLLDRMTGMTLPAGGTMSTSSYDAVGNMQTTTDFNGNTTSYAYDPLNRLLSKTPAASLNEPVVSFTYTGTGKRASMSDASGSTAYTYDNQDRLNTKATPQGTLTYSYDALGNVASIVSSNPNGASVNYTWDTLNRLSAVVDNRLPSGQNTTSYTYDLASNLGTVTYPNGVQSSFTYDSLNRLTALPISKGSTVASYTYGLGPAGNRQSVTELGGRQVIYTYDGIYRLTNEAIGSAPNGKNGGVGYALDPVGNRTARTSSLLAVSAATYSYDANDQLASETYDANGNVKVSGAATYLYDFENRLKSANNGAITILYDGDGNRVAKTVAGVTTNYLVDDMNPTGYPQVVEEVAGGVVQRMYAYGIQRISQNRLVGSAWATSFYGYDGPGAVRLLTDLTGTVTDTYDYDAFGNTINSTGSTPNNYLYDGEQFDADLGLYYLRARYYNPVTGRFLTRDTATGNAMNPISLHKYMYAEADPVNRIDPSGNGAAVAVGFGPTVGEALIIAGAQTLAVACIGGTALPVLGMGIAVSVGLEVYDVDMPFPCYVTFKTKPKAPKRPREILIGPQQQYGTCGQQEVARRYALQTLARAAADAFGACTCPRFMAYSKVALLEAYVAARLYVMACFEGGDHGHWVQVDGVDQGILNCLTLSMSCRW